jgi:drug/metabolite transporter (DMT)-like permease
LDYLAGKQIIKREVFGALLAVAGVAFLELDGFQGGLSAGNGISISSGDLFTLVQPLAFGLGFWRMEHYMRKFPTSAMQLTAAQLSMIAGVSVGVAVVTSPSDLPDFAQVSEWLSNPTILFAILWTGLITTALTVAMETFALKTLSAAETTMIFSTEPIFGGICASYVLHEQFGVGGLVGSAMVLGGCLYSKLGAVKEPETSV